MTCANTDPCADSAPGSKRTHLIVTRKKGDSILIGDSIEIIVHGIQSGHGARIGIKAPADTLILRGEVAARQREGSQ